MDFYEPSNIQTIIYFWVQLKPVLLSKRFNPFKWTSREAIFLDKNPTSNSQGAFGAKFFARVVKFTEKMVADSWRWKWQKGFFWI